MFCLRWWVATWIRPPENDLNVGLSGPWISLAGWFGGRSWWGRRHPLHDDITGHLNSKQGIKPFKRKGLIQVWGGGTLCLVRMVPACLPASFWNGFMQVSLHTAIKNEGFKQEGSATPGPHLLKTFLLKWFCASGNPIYQARWPPLG